jgi:hypothetical protein
MESVVILKATTSSKIQVLLIYATFAVNKDDSRLRSDAMIFEGRMPTFAETCCHNVQCRRTGTEGGGIIFLRNVKAFFTKWHADIAGRVQFSHLSAAFLHVSDTYRWV